jgi:hypothetical protein
MNIERAAIAKKDDGREKMAHCVIITIDIRNKNLKDIGEMSARTKAVCMMERKRTDRKEPKQPGEVSDESLIGKIA